MSSDQLEAISFLDDPKTFGAEVRRIDTHGAIVFLAGGDAYKIKRAVEFPFMDLSTLEKRRIACHAEIDVNKPNAPGVYIEAVPITRGASGLTFGGAGEIIEWVVHMRRFDESSTLELVAERGGISDDLIARLASAVVHSHRRAPRRDGETAARSLELYLDQNDAAFAADPDLFAPDQAKDLTRRARAALAAVKSLLIARGESGYVRRCHGDLHLRNIALIDGEPTLFDAIEFDDAIATGDILYDLAFLLMDLEQRGLRAAANLLFNRYLWMSDELQFAGLAALPLFLSIRAAIRAKVLAANLVNLEGGARTEAASEARRYFCFAGEFLKPRPARLVAIGGLSGTGKSALASEIAPLLGRSPGAVWLRSDIERKRLFQVEETKSLPEEAYSEETGRQVYARLGLQAALVLTSGQSVVLDAVHSQPGDQESVERLAAGLGVAFDGIWLEAPLKTRLKRVSARKNDASDADAAVTRSQRAQRPDSPKWRRLDASTKLAGVTKTARTFLGPFDKP